MNPEARMIGLLGMVVILGLAWALSIDRRRALNPRIIAWGLGLPILMAVVTLRTAVGARFFIAANDTADAVIGFANKGISLVFGSWTETGSFSGTTPDGHGFTVTTGFIFAVQVLPIIIFMASMMAVLYHLGIMQRVVAVLARVMSRLMNISGAEALSTVGDIFLGMTEAPLLIRPYVAKMTQSELFAVMTAGMATIAGSVLLAYKAMGIDAGYLVTASFMNAPLAVLIAKIMVPEQETPETMGAVRLSVPRIDVNIFDAAARGASEGLQLALNVGAMLIAFVAIIYMVDGAVGFVGDKLHLTHRLRLADLLGYPLAPLAWVMGVPWEHAVKVGALLGTKTVLNEFLAY